MNNTIGNLITLTVFGESHGPAIGGVLDGLPPGLAVDEAYIASQMDLRRAVGKISTGRHEADVPEFLSGVKNGRTEGTPLAFMIRNSDVKRSDYDMLAETARPSHADYTGHVKYSGFQDASGGGHFSGRLTAVITAAGAILRQVLEQKGIVIGTHIRSLHGIEDDPFLQNELVQQIRALNAKDFAVLNEETGKQMIAEIEHAASLHDSLGGILETAVSGLPAGIGEPMFDSLESRLSHALFSIPAVKGVEFGSGWELAQMYGSEANDAFGIEDGQVITLTNHNGGINGGISNGMPVLFRTVIKPTPSIARLQKTVNFRTMEETEITIQGRHDPAIVHRARVVQDTMTALVLADLLAQHFGLMWLKEDML
ncbi:MAG TPA: chorismate synthase [Erysipelotrichaceae bacterium]|nr:chorismate synthase [Erysipelotrichaceae bacterium]